MNDNSKEKGKLVTYWNMRKTLWNKKILGNCNYRNLNGWWEKNNEKTKKEKIRNINFPFRNERRKEIHDRMKGCTWSSILERESHSLKCTWWGLKFRNTGAILRFRRYRIFVFVRFFLLSFLRGFPFLSFSICN